jgi:hypothetical protein
MQSNQDGTKSEFNRTSDDARLGGDIRTDDYDGSATNYGRRGQDNDARLHGSEPGTLVLAAPPGGPETQLKIFHRQSTHGEASSAPSAVDWVGHAETTLRPPSAGAGRSPAAASSMSAVEHKALNSAVTDVQWLHIFSESVSESRLLTWLAKQDLTGYCRHGLGSASMAVGAALTDHVGALRANMQAVLNHCLHVSGLGPMQSNDCATELALPYTLSTRVLLPHAVTGRLDYYLRAQYSYDLKVEVPMNAGDTVNMHVPLPGRTVLNVAPSRKQIEFASAREGACISGQIAHLKQTLIAALLEVNRCGYAHEEYGYHAYVTHIPRINPATTANTIGSYTHDGVTWTRAQTRARYMHDPVGMEGTPIALTNMPATRAALSVMRRRCPTAWNMLLHSGYSFNINHVHSEKANADVVAALGEILSLPDQGETLTLMVQLVSAYFEVVSLLPEASGDVTMCQAIEVTTRVPMELKVSAKRATRMRTKRLIAGIAITAYIDRICGHAMVESVLGHKPSTDQVDGSVNTMAGMTGATGQSLTAFTTSRLYQNQLGSNVEFQHQVKGTLPAWRLRSDRSKARVGSLEECYDISHINLCSVLNKGLAYESQYTDMHLALTDVDTVTLLTRGTKVPEHLFGLKRVGSGERAPDVKAYRLSRYELATVTGVQKILSYRRENQRAPHASDYKCTIVAHSVTGRRGRWTVGQCINDVLPRHESMLEQAMSEVLVKSYSQKLSSGLMQGLQVNAKAEQKAHEAAKLARQMAKATAKAERRAKWIREHRTSPFSTDEEIAKWMPDEPASLTWDSDDEFERNHHVNLRQAVANATVLKDTLLHRVKVAAGNKDCIGNGYLTGVSALPCSTTMHGPLLQQSLSLMAIDAASGPHAEQQGRRPDAEQEQAQTESDAVADDDYDYWLRFAERCRQLVGTRNLRLAARQSAIRNETIRLRLTEDGATEAPEHKLQLKLQKTSSALTARYTDWAVTVSEGVCTNETETLMFLGNGVEDQQLHVLLAVMSRSVMLRREANREGDIEPLTNGVDMTAVVVRRHQADRRIRMRLSRIAVEAYIEFANANGLGTSAMYSGF